MKGEARQTYLVTNWPALNATDYVNNDGTDSPELEVHEMKGSTFRKCGCRNPDTGRKYPVGACPRLSSRKRADRDHGAWWARFDAPPGPDGKRRQILIGPYDTEQIADVALAKELARLGSSGHVTDRVTKTGEYLESWLDGKRGLKKTTFDSYREAIDLYLKPGLGHLRLCDLREHHISDLVIAMGQINRPQPDQGRPSEMLRRLLEVRAGDERQILPPGETRRTKSTRSLSPARIKRLIAVLNTALNAAARAKLIDSNPAANVDLPRVRLVKPLVWTKPRVRDWLATGRVPGPVMVWTPKQTGSFLDFIADERLYALFHLTAFTGPRRGEVAGLTWAEVDLEESYYTIRETRYDDDPDVPKSEAGTRTLPLDPITVQVLRDWQRYQFKERLAAGSKWVDSGVVFTEPKGSPLRPEWIGARFDTLITKYGLIRRGLQAGKPPAQLARKHNVPVAAVEVTRVDPLPPIRFHDLRHGAATLSLAAGVDMKVIAEHLGHSKSSFTSDVYTSVIPQVAQAAAEAVAAIVPRNRPTPGGTGRSRSL
jgi:integrase